MSDRNVTPNTATSSRDRLQEIRARLDAATPGPWERHSHDICCGETYVTDERGRVVGTSFWSDDSNRHENLEFIAHAPADIAFLLDEVERLRDKMERNMPWWRRDADGSLWVAPPTVGGEPEPDSHKWVRVQ